jgi:putative hemolysin
MSSLQTMWRTRTTARRYALTHLLLLVLTAAVLAGCAVDTTAEQPADTGLANPASEYCVEQGGRVEIRTDADGGEQGFCVFSDGSECEEWAYFRGECEPDGTGD